ncbi:MAG: hypothetical protein EPN47_04280 [Acidobacteria bacterium]|nr:MAG: hypothetical protein EPN47_04280 [Acidobacteriota bacterium]
MHRRSFLGTALAGVLPTGLGSNVNEAWPAIDPVVLQGGISPRGICIAYNGKSSPESAAALELEKFLKQMTGTAPLLFDASVQELQIGRGATFHVGRTISTTRLISSGKIKDPAEKDSEAYLVQTVSAPGPKQLVFLGGTGIATLYAVYHYLQRHCGVGCFADGDHVPQRTLIPVDGIDIFAQPRFKERMHQSLCTYWYAVPWWRWEDWQKYLDWALKNRYNIISLQCNPGEDIVWHKTWNKFGVDVADGSYSGPPYGIYSAIKYGIAPPLPAAWREGQSELTQKIIHYARARGMRTLVPFVPGIVPPEFHRVYPDAPTFKLTWLGPSHVQQYLLPSSTLYHDVGKAFLEEYLSLYGTDHLYWLETYLECSVIGDDRLQREVRRDIAAANFQIVDELDPQATGFIEGWSYLDRPEIWTPALVKESLDKLPMNRIRIIDFWERYRLYEEMDYWWRRPWHFGAIRVFGYSTYLFGNLPLMEQQFRQIAKDPRADQCVGFSSLEETLGDNYFCFQFLAKLGWNPAETSLRSFTREYALQRFGSAAAPSMIAVLEELLARTYRDDEQLAFPLYWKRLGTSEASIIPRHSAAHMYIPSLRRALERALTAKLALAENPLALHDLNDIARKYLAELFSFHLIAMNAAFEESRETRFEQEAVVIHKIMTFIESLLSHDDYYWLSPSILKARTLPGAPADIDRRVRDILTLWAGAIVDYACRDYYELVEGYYRPRVQAYVRKLGEDLHKGQRVLNRVTYDGKLVREYEAIEKKWVNEGFPLVERKPDPQRVIATVEEILKEFPCSGNDAR